ncbi:MAG TPA: DNA-directed RNA polymerase subunit beta', partial [Desulfomicrobiaceae bacterium]|nr:DNA-directed RNA polymerase subunit beta' [Desulfomicrobiaceae bacterium]
YGRDLARGHAVNVGESVGIIAAQSIGEPGTQLTMRTFHIGGTASKEVEQSEIKALNNGRVTLSRVRTVTNAAGELMAMGKSGQMRVVDEQGLERERYPLPTGAKIYFESGDEVKKGDLLAEWDPFNEPFVTDVEGVIRFSDIVEGRTVQERVDEATNRATLTIMEYRSTNFRPSISICDENGVAKVRQDTNTQAAFTLPVGAILMVKDGEEVKAGEVIARKPRETSKTKDIVGGLPRVAELFEVRKPKDQAIMSEIDGLVSFGPDSKGKRKIIVTPEVGDPIAYLIPKGKHVTVGEGDFVECGEHLTEGTPDLHDLLSTQGEKFLAKYLVDEVQEVYRFQGVYINDKHIEIIVRQMLKKLNVLDSGDTGFLLGEQVDKVRFKEENDKCRKLGLRAAVAAPMVLGITQASLSTESFISAASFQETTKVLTEASLMGKEDYLHGLKENVIVGRLVNAGTGFRGYVESEIVVPEQPESPDKFLEELERDPFFVQSPAI